MSPLGPVERTALVEVELLPCLQPIGGGAGGVQDDIVPPPDRAVTFSIHTAASRSVSELLIPLTLVRLEPSRALIGLNTVSGIVGSLMNNSESPSRFLMFC